MRSIFKVTLLAAVGAAVFAAGPAAAQKSRHTARAPVNYRTDPPSYVPANPAVVTDDGTYIGRDPDAQIRGELLKNAPDHNGNAY
jgi:hypothetical protein